MMSKKAFGLAGMLILASLMLCSMVSADSVVGVVYRGWTQAECSSAFSFATVYSELGEKLTAEQKAGKGPLTTISTVLTECYCSGEKVMDDAGTDCTDCYILYPGILNANQVVVHVSNDKAVEDAVLLYKGKDVGCRCSKTFSGNILDRDASIGKNTCVYKKPTSDDELCSAQYGDAKKCAAGSDTSSLVGPVYNDAGALVECCCEAGKTAIEVSPGKFSCTTEDSAKNAECAKKEKNLVACTAESMSFTEADVGASLNGEDIECCCADGYYWDGSKCVDEKENNKCWEIVEGSVPSGREDAGTSKVGDSYKGYDWDPEIRAKLGSLECYCQTGSVPKVGAEQTITSATMRTQTKVQYVVGCAEITTGDSCSDIFPGSVGVKDFDAQGGILIEGSDWNQDLIELAADKGIACSCPKGSIPYDSKDDNDQDKDSCAFVNPRMINSEHVAALLKVGACSALGEDDNTYTITFNEPTIVWEGSVTVQEQQESWYWKATEGLTTAIDRATLGAGSFVAGFSLDLYEGIEATDDDNGFVDLLQDIVIAAQEPRCVPLEDIVPYLGMDSIEFLSESVAIQAATVRSAEAVASGARVTKLTKFLAAYNKVGGAAARVVGKIPGVARFAGLGASKYVPIIGWAYLAVDAVSAAAVETMTSDLQFSYDAGSFVASRFGISEPFTIPAPQIGGIGIDGEYVGIVSITSTVKPGFGRTGALSWLVDDSIIDIAGESTLINPASGFVAIYYHCETINSDWYCIPTYKPVTTGTVTEALEISDMPI